VPGGQQRRGAAPGSGCAVPTGSPHPSLCGELPGSAPGWPGWKQLVLCLSVRMIAKEKIGAPGAG